MKAEFILNTNGSAGAKKVKITGDSVQLTLRQEDGSCQSINVLQLLAAIEAIDLIERAKA